jgi:solute carrier family 44 (choline transporter-like protein), member 2/4/5
MMFLMRFIAGIIVWVSVIGIILIFIGGGVIFLYNAGVFGGEDLGTLGIPTLEPNDWYSTYGYICFGVAGVLLIFLLCCCSRIRLAVAVARVAGRFVLRVAQVMLVPIIMTFFILGLWAFSLSAMVYIISRATFVADGDIFTSLDSLTETTLGMFYYFVFGTLWTNAFLGALTIFIIASCCCMWYFTQGP